MQPIARVSVLITNYRLHWTAPRQPLPMPFEIITMISGKSLQPWIKIEAEGRSLFCAKLRRGNRIAVIRKTDQEGVKGRVPMGGKEKAVMDIKTRLIVAR